MIDILATIAAFVVALGLLIAVHEFGHFWVARRMGVKVLRFSIGFGRPLLSWRGRDADATEYVVAALPLGGYVKMLDEREGDVAPEEVHRAFNRQPVGKRFAVVSAGPLFNLAFAVIAYWATFVVGVPGLKPILGEVLPDTPAAAAGLQEGERILSVAGNPTPTWGAVVDNLFPHLIDRDPVAMTVAGQGGEPRSVQLPLARMQGDLEPDQLMQRVGLTPYRPDLEPVIGEVEKGSVADFAGLRTGDRVVAFDGRPVENFTELVETVRANPGTPLEFTVKRDGETQSLSIRPLRVDSDEGPIGRIGAGVQVDPAALDALRAEQRFGPVEAVGEAFAKTRDMSVLTLRMFGEMLVGRASTENISGPITIAQFAKQSAFAGLSQFLGFLAIVSLSLGVLNLLPVPILDGGHLMFYLVEIVKGKPVSEKTEAAGQKIGIILILALMGLAFYNDLARLAG